MTKVKWFKIMADIFNDQKIRAIEMLPEGDTIIVIWFKLLALAATSNNNGVVMFTETIPYTEDLLISYLGKKETTTRLAFDTFKKWGMLETIDEEQILISNWNKYQNVNGLDKIREQNRLRQQTYRDKQKDLLLETKEKKIKDKKNIDSDNELHNVTNNVTQIISYLNQKLGTSYKSTSKETQKYIKARIKQGFTLDDFYKVIDNKYNDWFKTDMAQYLRPVTLFGTKFESYLNQVTKKKEKVYDL